MKLYLLFFLAFALQSCNSTKTTALNTLPDGTYIFDLEYPKKYSTRAPMQITFDSGTTQVNGYSGCNRFFGSYVMTNNSLTIGPLASTKMACIEDGLNALETKILKGLNSTDSYILKTANSSSVIEFYSDGELVLKASKTVPKNDIKS